MTGGGTGIGRATAHAFAARGARVLAVGRSESTLAETAKDHDTVSALANAMGALDRAAIVAQVNTNLLAPIFLTQQALAGMPRETYEKFLADMLTKIPSGRIGSPGEIAWWIVHLTEPNAEYANGALFAIDGALSVT
ncbi:MAG: SDR family NAD(P)-dependent oxidoreductase [Pseudonocardiaceae bacterium]